MSIIRHLFCNASVPSFYESGEYYRNEIPYSSSVNYRVLSMKTYVLCTLCCCYEITVLIIMLCSSAYSSYSTMMYQCLGIQIGRQNNL